MKFPTRVEPPTITAFPVQLATRPAPDPRVRIAELEKALDARDGAEMAATQRAEQAEKECGEIAAQRDAAVVERDELAGASLPLLGGPVLPTADPPDAVIYEDLRRTHGGWV